MSKTTKVILVVVIIVVASIGAGAWFVVGRGYGAREEPTAIEAFVARRLRGLATPKHAKKAVNPVEPSKEALSEAMAHFADHCAICHGNDGSGETSIGTGLYPKPPDMRQPQTQNLTDGELFYIIENGIRLTGMPAFGQATAESAVDSWKLVHFIRHLPSITDDELATMKSMNPKSQHELEEEEAIDKFLKGDDTQSPPAHKHE